MVPTQVLTRDPCAELVRFVSHYWGTCFHYTVRALRLHAAAMTSPEDAKDATCRKV